MTRDIRAGGLDRRTFLKGSAAAGLATGLGVLPWATAVNARVAPFTQPVSTRARHPKRLRRLRNS